MKNDNRKDQVGGPGFTLEAGGSLTPPANASAAANQEPAIPGSSVSSEASVDVSSILVKIERVERDDGPMIRVPYDDGSGTTQHADFAPDRDTFEVTAIVAAAAIETGFFRAVE